MRKRIRAAGITIKDGAVLLLWRDKNGRQYYVFPGGGVEEGETKEEAVVRELMEETSVTVRVKKLIYHHTYTKAGKYDSDQFFYLCDYVLGEPKLGDFNEKKDMDGGKNLYKPMWASLKKIGVMRVFPIEIRDWLIQDVKDDFSKVPRRQILGLEELRNQ